jgi:hypothetical protein
VASPTHVQLGLITPAVQTGFCPGLHVTVQLPPNVPIAVQVGFPLPPPVEEAELDAVTLNISIIGKRIVFSKVFIFLFVLNEKKIYPYIVKNLEYQTVYSNDPYWFDSHSFIWGSFDKQVDC